MTELLSQRLALLRVKHNLTQQEVADRLAISRVAVSHLEAGLSVPSERTITLLAGLYKCEPLDLVSGTNYPDSKAERLPAVACRYTEVELQLALLEHDIGWLRRITDTPNYTIFMQTVYDKWALILERLARNSQDRHDQELIARGRVLLQRLPGTR